MNKTDPLAKIQAQTARYKTPVRDEQDRKEATYAPDARKARDVVKSQAGEPGGHDLVFLAKLMAHYMTEPGTKQALEQAADAVLQAAVIYRRAELQDVNTPIGWLGGDRGLIPPGPFENAPEHKRQMIDAWNALVMLVYDTTKVGVRKANRFRPIELTVDLDGSRPTLVQGADIWD